MWKFKLPEGKRSVDLFLLTIGVILCILAFPVGNKEKRMLSPTPGYADTSENTQTVSQDAAAYEKKLELRVKELLRNVSGVGGSRCDDRIKIFL